jgi:hypothetical protein
MPVKSPHRALVGGLVLHAHLLHACSTPTVSFRRIASPCQPHAADQQDPVQERVGDGESEPANHPDPDETPVTDDRSGTEPTQFLRTASLRNDYQRVSEDRSFDLASFTDIELFADGRMNLRLEAPLAFTDARGSSDAGIGDVSLRYNWLPSVDASHGILVGAEIIGDTATEATLGPGKWIVGPSLTYAMFLSPTRIFAPSYPHGASGSCVGSE